MTVEPINPHHILFSGYAKLPAGITASEMYKVIGVIVVVDVTSGVIQDADCTLATALARRHVTQILIGQNIHTGPEQIIQIVDRIYQGSAKKAIITCLRIIYDKYRSYADDQNNSL